MESEGEETKEKKNIGKAKREARRNAGEQKQRMGNGKGKRETGWVSGAEGGGGRTFARVHTGNAMVEGIRHKDDTMGVRSDAPRRTEPRCIAASALLGTAILALATAGDRRHHT